MELFSYKIEKSEEIEEKINIFLGNEDNNTFLQLLEYYNRIKNEIKLVPNMKLNLYKYKFFYDDEITVSKIISKFGEIKLIPKTFTFMGNQIQDKKGIITYENTINKEDNNNNYNTNNDFKHYNFMDNINSLKNKNDSSSNLYKKQNNSCNNTINNHKIKKIINNNINRNLKLKTFNNEKVIDSNYINNTFTNTHKKNMPMINYTQKINGGMGIINSPHSMHQRIHSNCRNNNNNNNGNYINKYNLNLNKINGNNLKNNNIRKGNQFKSNCMPKLIKYYDYQF